MKEEDLISLITAEVVAQILKENQLQGHLTNGTSITSAVVSKNVTTALQNTSLQSNTASTNVLPVAMSNRHIHLSQAHVEQLFGAGYTLTKLKDLSQPGQFAAKETVRLIGPKGIIEEVRVLGPARNATQIELAISDGFKLGITAPIRQSGDIAGTPGIFVAGPKGVVELTHGVIIALRHIHMAPEDAARFGVQDKVMVKVQTKGLRSLIFDQVLVRVSPDFRLEMHVDLEEGNAAGLKNGDLVEILK